MTLPADVARCNGAQNPVNLRPLVICQDCERRHFTGNDSLSGPPAKHDGTKWVCDARIVREDNRS